MTNLFFQNWPIANWTALNEWPFYRLVGFCVQHFLRTIIFTQTIFVYRYRDGFRHIGRSHYQKMTRVWLADFFFLGFATETSNSRSFPSAPGICKKATDSFRTREAPSRTFCVSYRDQIGKRDAVTISERGESQNGCGLKCHKLLKGLECRFKSWAQSSLAFSNFSGGYRGRGR